MFVVKFQKLIQIQKGWNKQELYPTFLLLFMCVVFCYLYT